MARRNDYPLTRGGEGHTKLGRVPRRCRKGNLNSMVRSSTSSRPEKKLDQFYGGPSSFGHGLPQRWTSMRDTCAICGKEHCSNRETRDYKYCSTTYWNYTEHKSCLLLQ